MAKKADISGKKLISLAPEAWVRWTTGLADVVAESIVSEEFQWVSRESDVLIKAYSAALGSFLVLIELQLEYTQKMPRRMRAYAGLAEEKYELPVYPILVNLSPAPNTDYRVINLWEVPAEEVLNLHLSALLPLVPLTKGGDTEEAIRRAYLQLQADESLRDDEQRTELVNLLHIFGNLVTSEDLMARIMGGDMLSLVREGSAVDKLLKTQEHLTRENYARELALRLINHRFGLIDVDLASRINSLSAEKASNLTEAVLDFKSLAELKAWLDAETVN